MLTQRVKRHYQGKLEDTRSLLDASLASEKSLKAELEQLRAGLPSREQFVELVHSYLEILLKTTDLIEEDTIYQELVLNLRVGDNAVSVIKLNPPYDLMVDLDKVVRGGPIGPPLEQVTRTLPTAIRQQRCATSFTISTRGNGSVVPAVVT